MVEEVGIYQYRLAFCGYGYNEERFEHYLLFKSNALFMGNVEIDSPKWEYKQFVESKILAKPKGSMKWKEIVDRMA